MRNNIKSRSELASRYNHRIKAIMEKTRVELQNYGFMVGEVWTYADDMWDFSIESKGDLTVDFTIHHDKHKASFGFYLHSKDFTRLYAPIPTNHWFYVNELEVAEAEFRRFESVPAEPFISRLRRWKNEGGL